jgi:hypothetical protein
LDATPVAVEDVLPRIDEPMSLCHRFRVDRVRSHASTMAGNPCGGGYSAITAIDQRSGALSYDSCAMAQPVPPIEMGRRPPRTV